MCSSKTNGYGIYHVEKRLIKLRLTEGMLICILPDWWFETDLSGSSVAVGSNSSPAVLNGSATDASAHLPSKSVHNRDNVHPNQKLYKIQNLDGFNNME